jgi:hypothetical protein
MDEYIAHSEVWALAIIMIVIASWIFYRHFAPKTWREWAGAGLVQAFIIALYAEMYGFPLTIYLLVRFFGLDRNYLNANLWSTLLGMGETGMLISMVVGYALLFIGIGLFIQGWRELYHARQENRLATEGLYGPGQAPSIYRPVYRPFWRRRGALANYLLRHLVSRDCACLWVAGVSGGAGDAGAIWGAVPHLPGACADVLSRQASMAAVHRRLADGRLSASIVNSTAERSPSAESCA